MDVEALVKRLRAYRSRNDWGDPASHSICHEAADALASLASRVAELERERDTWRNNFSAMHRQTMTAEARVKELEREYDLADKSDMSARELLTMEEAKTEELVARVAELEKLIDKAQIAASETQPSWKHRCYAILAALGLDYGDPDWEMPDEQRRREAAEARVAELERALIADRTRVEELGRDWEAAEARATALAAEVERYRIALDVTRMQLESIAPQHSNDPFHASAIDIARAALEGKDNG